MSEPDEPQPESPEARAAAAPAVADPAAELRSRLRFAHLLNGVLGVVIAGLLVAVIVLALRPAGAPAPEAIATPAPASSVEETAAPAQTVPDLSRRDPSDPLAIGAVDAPVVIIEWVDYRCPFCAKFANETMPELVAEYVDTGLARWEFHDVAFFGEDSVAAAVAARAAAAQGRFHEYLTVLYAAAPPEGGHPDMPREKLIGFAEQAGVPDLAAFTAALDDPALLAAVQASHDEAVALGVSSVPTFVIGQSVLQGAYPIDVFRQAIDAELAAAG